MDYGARGSENQLSAEVTWCVAQLRNALHGSLALVGTITLSPLPRDGAQLYPHNTFNTFLSAHLFQNCPNVLLFIKWTISYIFLSLWFLKGFRFICYVSFMGQYSYRRLTKCCARTSRKCKVLMRSSLSYTLNWGVYSGGFGFASFS